MTYRLTSDDDDEPPWLAYPGYSRRASWHSVQAVGSVVVFFIITTANANRRGAYVSGQTRIGKLVWQGCAFCFVRNFLTTHIYFIYHTYLYLSKNSQFGIIWLLMMKANSMVIIRQIIPEGRQLFRISKHKVARDHDRQRGAAAAAKLYNSRERI